VTTSLPRVACHLLTTMLALPQNKQQRGASADARPPLGFAGGESGGEGGKGFSPQADRSGAGRCGPAPSASRPAHPSSPRTGRKRVIFPRRQLRRKVPRTHGDSGKKKQKEEWDARGGRGWPHDPGGQYASLVKVEESLEACKLLMTDVVNRAPPPEDVQAIEYRCYCCSEALACYAVFGFAFVFFSGSLFILKRFCSEAAPAFGMRDTLMAHLEDKHLRCILRRAAALVLLVCVCFARRACCGGFVCCVCLVCVLPEASEDATPVSDAFCGRAETLRQLLFERPAIGVTDEARDGAAREARRELAVVLTAGQYEPPGNTDAAARELQQIAASFGQRVPGAGEGRVSRTGSATKTFGGKAALACFVLRGRLDRRRRAQRLCAAGVAGFLGLPARSGGRARGAARQRAPRRPGLAEADGLESRETARGRVRPARRRARPSAPGSTGQEDRDPSGESEEAGARGVPCVQLWGGCQ
jgi:hypothetical protein